MLKKIFTVCFVAFFALSYGVMAAPNPALGLVVAKSVSMDGVKVPSGTTVLARTLLRTGSDPAFVHLSQGQVLQLDRNSSAYFESGESGETRVTVRSGTAAFQPAGAGLLRVAPESVILFPLSGPAVSTAQETTTVVLVQSAEPGQATIIVNDARLMDPKNPILLKSPDGQVQEIHYIESFEGNNVTLSAPLQNSFPANTSLIQNREAVTVASSAGVAVVGAAAGVSAGTALAGAAAGAAAGLSTAAVVGIVAGAATAATVGGLAIAGVGPFSEEEEVSP